VFRSRSPDNSCQQRGGTPPRPGRPLHDWGLGRSTLPIGAIR